MTSCLSSARKNTIFKNYFSILGQQTDSSPGLNKHFLQEQGTKTTETKNEVIVSERSSRAKPLEILIHVKLSLGTIIEVSIDSVILHSKYEYVAKVESSRHYRASQLYLCGNLADDGCIEEERHALLKFRDSFDNYSRDVLAWEGKECCKWKGVKCDGIIGHVVKIDLSPITNPMFFSYSNSYGFVNSSTIPFKVQVLNLRANSLDAIPKALQNMTSLRSIDLSHNIIDFVPLWFGKFKFLAHLNLSRNSISGLFPTAIQNLSTLTSLDISDNNLDSVPLWLGEFTFLAHLNLARHKLLESLNLSNNGLLGELPSTLSSWHLLEILDLGNNQLHGNIPSTFWEGTTRLKIPFCIGNLKGMMINKASNKGSKVDEAFEPIVAPTSPPAPPATPPFDQWEREDVKQFMKGRELNFTKNLKFVINMDLSNNNLVGFIPEVLTSLTGLDSLNLSHNSLSGEIPSKIGKMKFLESLDLSWNQLEGPLSSSMSSLTSLSHLNLSYNNFLGPIPKGNQFFTLEDSSIYIGNQYLCGELVLKKCNRDDNNEAPTYEGKDDDNKKEKIMFYFVVALGFMTGFWGAIGVLVFNKSLRYICFRYVEKIADEIYVAVAIRVARIKRIW
ncbi:probable LRR receptor-like serine/threonine-protein kinase IRK [Prosopis cineraria]|uniref:probable LRR receptor-like serine/threonine-protein kinase IRK n=1 Tax=Prosopis cineraria TaxID=364024 RepID=UPI0024104060|nr:probable LRR receptor-like serine/threonine-protein kinase IRK [Prosopis cineraria]